MTTFAEKMAAQKAAPKDFYDAEVTLGGELVTLRFTELGGDAWGEITDRCPLRLDAPIDRGYGYNMSAVCKLAAPLSGEILGGEVLTAEDWSDLLDVLSPHERTVIKDAIYRVNEYEPAQRIAALKKEFAVPTASEKTSK